MASIAGAIALLRSDLIRTSERFASAFTGANLTELASGDAIAIARRLESGTAGLPWTCIEASRAGRPFYRRVEGKCDSGFLRHEVVLGVADNANVEIRMTLGIPPGQLVVAAFLVAGQLALLYFLWASSRAIAGAEMTAILERERAEAAVHRSIAAMTAMLAHDARKPLSLMKIGLGMLNRAEGLDSMRRVLDKLAPQVDRALGSVNAMIADVMEAGSTSTEVAREAVSAEELIGQVVTDALRTHPETRVSVSYDLRHSRAIDGDPRRLGRALANLVGNAIEAVGGGGRIWIATRDVDTSSAPAVEILVGNPGHIPPGEVPRLFEPFYTKGKKGGTGLGLAIVKRIVTAHGGRVWCESDRGGEGGEATVEFKLVLPARLDAMATRPMDRSLRLPVGTLEAAGEPAAPANA
jgi:signal transduction histidine kinase